MALCECGCGGLAPIARQTDARLGHVRGEPVRFIRGHRAKLWTRMRIAESDYTVEDRGYETPCWIWKGAPHKRTGYCRVQIQGARHFVHRAMYEQEVGVIPAALDLDHLCNQRACLNPAHLEPVTRAENIRRSRTAKLTPADLALIRASTFSSAKLAALLGVSPRTIRDVRQEKTWQE